MNKKLCACGAALLGKQTKHCSVKCSNIYIRLNERMHLAKDSPLIQYWERWDFQSKIMHAALTSSTTIFNLKGNNHE